MTKKQQQKLNDRAWFEALLKPKCEVCGKKAIVVHHFYYKNSYGHLRYDKDNGISLCRGCHFVLHRRDSKKIEEIIIEKRGNRWFRKLQKKSRK